MQAGKKIIATGGGAVGLSLFASMVGLCCIGPWSVALLGVSGAVSMARWQPLRPYILGIAGIADVGVLAHLSAQARLPRNRLCRSAPGSGHAHFVVVVRAASGVGGVRQ
jgi:hypothetical protein